MELRCFIDALDALTLDDLRALAIDIDGLTATTAEEVEVIGAYLHIEAALRSQRRLRDASMAGHRANEAVRRVAARVGFDAADPMVSRVARWADTVARGIIAERETQHAVEILAHGADHIPVLAGITAF